MFGGGFAVGVAITRAEPAATGGVGLAERPSRLGEVLPPSRRTDGEIAADLQRMTAIEAALAAWRCQLVGELAARRPASADLTPIDRENGCGAPDGAVSEFFPDELALLLNSSRTAAVLLHEQAQTLLVRLPATWAALADGVLDWPRARAIADELGRPADGTDPAVVAAVEAVVLPQAASLSIRGLRLLARRELLAHDAAAADRRREQAKARVDVPVRRGEDGMAEVVSGHTAPTAAAIRDRVDQLAWLVNVLRPWETSRAPVTANLTIEAPLAALHDRLGSTAATGLVDGQPITAAHLRELLTELDLLGVGSPASSAGTVQVAITGPRGELLGTATLPELRRLVARDSPLGSPPDVDRYRPIPAQRRFITIRDRTCRHPGCSNRAGWADLDHVEPHAHGGPTSCANLCCLCRRHHRLKTLTRGWRFYMDPDGTRHVTTPSGVTRTTRPPGLHPAPAIGEPPPFWLREDRPVLITEDRGDVAVLRIEHGRVGALDVELLDALTEAVTAADRALVLTGSGASFSAGVDLRRVLDGGPSYAEDLLDALARTFRAVFDHPRPTVAAINGHAIAGGCVLALACDLRLMSGGRIGLTELAVGVPFPTSALEITRHALGPRTGAVLLGAATTDRDGALALGMVDELTEPAELLARAIELATELGARTPESYRLAKQQLQRPVNEAIAAAAMDDAAVLAGWTSDDTRRRIEAALAALSRRSSS